MSDKPRMLWVARDADGTLWTHEARPTKHGCGDWESDQDCAQWAQNTFPDLQPGECRMFIEFAPREATGFEGAALCWRENHWLFTSVDNGDIILPMLPDPAPHLLKADPKEARREEIRAQIAALQEELEGMEG